MHELLGCKLTGCLRKTRLKEMRTVPCSFVYLHVPPFPHAQSTAQRMRAATSEKAEAEKILQVKKAEGDAEAKYLAGVGVARQRQAIVDGLRESVMGFSEKVSGGE